MQFQPTLKKIFWSTPLPLNHQGTPKLENKKDLLLAINI